LQFPSGLFLRYPDVVLPQLPGTAGFIQLGR
jgi:hypothetical protein